METVEVAPVHPGLRGGERSFTLPYRLRTRLLLGAIGLALGIWCWSLFVTYGVLSDRPGVHGYVASDFTMLVSAATAMEQGNNPYDHRTLLTTERAFLAQRGLPLLVSDPEKIRVGYPPLFFWVIQPLTRLPFELVSFVWIAGIYALAALGFLCTLKFLHWRQWAYPTLLFLLLPQVIKGSLYGNASGLVFAGVSCSLLLTRSYPYAAGALLTTAWLKPQVGFAMILLIILFHVKERLKVLLGFGAASGLLLLLTLLATGPRSLAQWINGLTDYYHQSTVQLYLPAFVNLYNTWAPMPIRYALTSLCLVIAFAVTGVTWSALRRRTPLSPLSIAPLWFLWFVAIPYVHLYDEILLALPVLACLGVDGHRTTRSLPAFGLSVLALSWLPYAWIPLEAVVGLAVLNLLNVTAQRRVRSPSWLLLGLCLGWVIYGTAPMHPTTQSVLVVVAALCLCSVTLTRPGLSGDGRETWQIREAGR